jgi:uncharacterized protein (DUF1778 family)
MRLDLSKDERIELRISAKDKEVLKRAQELCGDKTFSSFAIRVLRREAEEVLSQHDKILASERDRQIFFDAVFNDSDPNPALTQAAEKYKSPNAS